MEKHEDCGKIFSLSKFSHTGTGKRMRLRQRNGEEPGYPTLAPANHGTVNVLRVGAARQRGGAHYVAPGWLTHLALQQLGPGTVASLPRRGWGPAECMWPCVFLAERLLLHGSYRVFARIFGRRTLRS